MDENLKKRLIGAGVIFALVVAVIPELLTGPAPNEPQVHLQGNQQMVSIDLTSDSLKASAAQSPSKSIDESVHAAAAPTMDSGSVIQSIQQWWRGIWHPKALSTSSNPLPAVAPAPAETTAVASAAESGFTPIEPNKVSESKTDAPQTAPKVNPTEAAAAGVAAVGLAAQAIQATSNGKPDAKVPDKALEKAPENANDKAARPANHDKATDATAKSALKTESQISGNDAHKDASKEHAKEQGKDHGKDVGKDLSKESVNKPSDFKVKLSDEGAKANKQAADKHSSETHPDDKGKEDKSKASKPKDDKVNISKPVDSGIDKKSHAEVEKAKPHATDAKKDSRKEASTEAHPESVKEARNDKDKNKAKEHIKDTVTDDGIHKPTHYIVHLGSFSDKQNAEVLAAKLRKEGLRARLVESHNGQTIYYRVRLAPESEREKAEKDVLLLKKMGIDARISP